MSHTENSGGALRGLSFDRIGYLIYIAMIRTLCLLIGITNKTEEVLMERPRNSIANKKNRQWFVSTLKALFLGQGKKPRCYVRTDLPLIDPVGPDKPYQRPNTTYERSWRELVLGFFFLTWTLFSGTGACKVKQTVRNDTSNKQSRRAA